MITMSVALDRFLSDPGRKLVTRKKYSYKLQPFIDLYGNLPIDQLTTDHLTGWLAGLESTLADASLAMIRSCLITFLGYCVTCGWLDRNPAKQLPRYSDRPQQVVTANEDHLGQALTICGILSRSDDAYHRRDSAIFALAAISGARRSNIMNLPYRETVKALESPDYDQRVGNIYKIKTRGKTAVSVVFGDWHAAIVRQWLEVRPESSYNRLFVHLAPRTLGKPLEANGLGHARKKICQIAGVPAITFQEMRRLKGTKIARQYNLELAAEALGHVSGTRVIRDHYYDPDRHAADVVILETGKS